MPPFYLEYLGDSIELPVGETVVGRDVGCMLRFNDPAVSRRHLRFIRREDEVFLEDLESANGTILNGRRVRGAMRLADGDVIHVGTRELTIRMPDVPSFEASTLTLTVSEVPPSFRERDPTPRPKMARTTTMMAVTVPPPMQEAPDPGGEPLVRRRHERHSIELPLIYVSTELEIEVATRNLSVSGVFVRSNILDPIGTKCRLTILVDGGPALEVNGVVRRVVDRQEAGDDFEGLGIEFVDVLPGQRVWLQNVVDRAQADDGEA
ncbi:MAG: FHA domain-containing protein [Deltaproteobacteria bacterium]|nr:FHA domain-containing protein [Deltaproteobacteria bacterium]